MVSVLLRTGRVNLTNRSSKVVPFYVPRRTDDIQEMLLDMAVDHPTVNRKVQKAGNKEIVSSVPGYRMDIAGCFVTQTYMFEEGSLFKVFVQVKPGYGKMPKNANVFFRARLNAALLDVSIEMIASPEVAYTGAKIRGRFDILTLDDVRAEGAVVSKMSALTGSPIAVESVLTEVRVLSPEIETPDMVRPIETGGDDNATKIYVRRRRRGLDS